MTGPVPVIPKYSYGNWWSRYFTYSDKSFEALTSRFWKEDIPFTVMIVDMDWHLVDIDRKYGVGWTGYTWNRELFKDPKSFIDYLHKNGYRVTLNLHPADGIRKYEDAFEKLSHDLQIKDENSISFDPADRHFLECFFKDVIEPLENDGVDFWWIDWQQGPYSKVPGLDPLWILNYAFRKHALDRDKDSIILSRYSGPGGHRFPIGFSGDTVVSWDTYVFQPEFTATASNIGFPWWSHDIGGHMEGTKDNELMARWVQFGVFSPIMRLHSTKNPFNGREPWNYGEESEKVIKKFLRFRHQMIPYLFSENIRTSRERVPFIQPLYYREPFNEETYKNRNEYYFGENIIVNPVTEKRDAATLLGKANTWIPDGIWIDIFTGCVYRGGRWLSLYRGLDSLPVLLRGGAVLPLDGRKSGNSIDISQDMEVFAAAGGNGNFTLNESDEQVINESVNHCVETVFTVSDDGKTFTLSINVKQDEANQLPVKRNWLIHLLGIQKVDLLSCTVYGEEVPYTDSFNHQLYDVAAKSTG